MAVLQQTWINQGDALQRFPFPEPHVKTVTVRGGGKHLKVGLWGLSSPADFSFSLILFLTQNECVGPILYPAARHQLVPVSAVPYYQNEGPQGSRRS